MKYIRTKDGRIKKVRDGFEGKEWENSDKYFYSHYHSQADTIEELCDEFIILKTNEKPFIALYPLKCFQTKKSIEFQNKENIRIYGAIWTDKGLTYVAKMNEKGELELL